MCSVYFHSKPHYLGVKHQLENAVDMLHPGPPERERRGSIVGTANKTGYLVGTMHRVDLIYGPQPRQVQFLAALPCCGRRYFVWERYVDGSLFCMVTAICQIKKELIIGWYCSLHCSCHWQSLQSCSAHAGKYEWDHPKGSQIVIFGQTTHIFHACTIHARHELRSTIDAAK